jgi:hypothetical protein
MEIMIGVIGVAATLIATLVMAVLAWLDSREVKKLLGMLLTGQERAGHIRITRDSKGQPMAIDVRVSFAAQAPVPTLKADLEARGPEEQGGGSP